MKKILVILVLVLGVTLGAVVYLKSEKGISVVSENRENVSINGSSFLTQDYTDPEFSYSIKLPAGYKVESEGKYSKIFLPESVTEGVVPVNFIYVSVVTPDMKESVGEIYNYNPDHFKKLIALKNVGESVNLVDSVPDLAEWYTYKLVGEENIDNSKVKNFQNNKPWEFPGGATENKFIYVTASNIYILGYYTGGDSVAQKSRLDPSLTSSVIKSFKVLR